MKMSANPRAQSVSSTSSSSMSSMFSHIVSKGSKYMEGVKNLVVGTKVRLSARYSLANGTSGGQLEEVI